MDYWPSYIPKPSSLSESVDDPYIEATSETGDDAARVRYSKERQGPTKLTWKIMRLGDFVALKQFYAEHRAIEFLWLHPSRGLTYKTRFVSSPISSSEDGKSPFVAQVEVTLQIVELAPTEQAQPSVDDLMATVNEGADRAVQAAVDAGQARDAAQEAARQAAATAAEIPAAVEAGIERIETAGTTQVSVVNSAGSTQVANVNSAGTTQIAAVEAAGTEQVATVKAEGQTQTAAAKAQADAAAASAQKAADRLNEFKDIGATATTLAAGSDATASFDASTGVLTIGVPQGIQGIQGETGKPFSIRKTYPSIADMEADFDGTDTDTGDFVVIDSNAEDPDNAKLYYKGSAAWQYLTDLSGAQGMQGPAATIEAGTVTTLAPDSPATVTNSGTSSSAVFNFGIPKGEKGDKGDKGDPGTEGPQGPAGEPAAAAVTPFGYLANEREAVLPSGSLLTVPSYQVGSNMIFVYLDNGLCLSGREYEETGDSGSMSTQIKILFDLHPYHELIGYVLSAVVDPDDPSAVQRITVLEDRIDSVIPLPVGFVAVYAGTDEPLGWRRLDGQTITGVSSVFPDFKAWAVDDGHAVLCTLEEYETELTTYEGQCGKFGWDADTDTLRLPTVTGFIGAAASTDEIGKAELAGLPNILGSGGFSMNSLPDSRFSGAFYQDSNTGTEYGNAQADLDNPVLKFDASRSSPIYGRSPNSVTPPSVRYPYIIKVADAVYPPSVMDARKMATLVSSLREEVPGMAAHAAGPSEQYIDFSLPEKEGSYTAPADGWIALMAKPTGTNAILQILVYPPDTVPDGSSYIWRDEYVTVNATQYAYLKTRVSKGQVVQLNWGSVESFTYSRFIYSSGNAPA